MNLAPNTRTVRSFRAFALVAGVAASITAAVAGPGDQFTKYPIGVKLGDVTIPGILDSGGTSTVSFEHAKALGILDADGDPELTPDGSQTLGGTGGGGVACHVFNNVQIEIQPRKPDGSPNGPPRMYTITIFVPKKPSEQTGSSDAIKQKKVDSVPTKLGANVSGATLDSGHKIDEFDKPTGDPKVNLRGTRWIKVEDDAGAEPPTPPQRRAPAGTDDNFEDANIQETILHQFAINNQPAGGMTTLLPVTAVDEQAAQMFNIIPIEIVPLDLKSHQWLYVAGVVNVLPDPNNPLMLPVGFFNLQIPTLEGQPILNNSVATFILPQNILVNPNIILLGGNALVPPNTQFFMDLQTQTFNWVLKAPPCEGDFNQDGTTNTLDVLQFLNAFNAQDPYADWNWDGTINTLDVLQFLNQWSVCRNG